MTKTKKLFVNKTLGKTCGIQREEDGKQETEKYQCQKTFKS